MDDPDHGFVHLLLAPRIDIQTTGWWTVFPHREWETVATLDPKELGLDSTAVMEVEGATGTFEELRAGVETPRREAVQWVGNRRIGRIEVQDQEWTRSTGISRRKTTSRCLTGKDFEYERPDGTVEVIPGDNFWGAILNSHCRGRARHGDSDSDRRLCRLWLCLDEISRAAYCSLSWWWRCWWSRCRLRWCPFCRDYARLNLNGTFLAIWLAHTGFGLPLAVYLLFNYIRTLPREILESAFIDGASHFTVFTRLILPLSLPALASFAIFQFLWVWNDYLVALIFLGGNPETQVLTMRLANIVGSRGNDWHLLTAGAFVTMMLPLVVFFSLQRYFVRGLLAGSVKG